LALITADWDRERRRRKERGEDAAAAGGTKIKSKIAIKRSRLRFEGDEFGVVEEAAGRPFGEFDFGCIVR